MGTNVSRPKQPSVRKQHKDAEKVLFEDKKKTSNVFKLLLLGSSDSGKSTIVKQMRILHKNGFSKNELLMQRSTVAWNVFQSITAILHAMQRFDIKFEHLGRQLDAECIFTLERDAFQDAQSIDYDYWMRIKRLWCDPGVQACYERANEYQLSDSAKYFFDDIDRISAKDYIPTEQDVLRVRASTTSIVELDFQLKGMRLKLIDVGGQRSQRKKWIHCFDNVNGVIFVAAISEYNQMLSEQKDMNRIHESLTLFGSIINSPWFTKTSVILFLNKKDIFEEKLKKHSLTAAFPEYAGQSTYDDAVAYVQAQFESQKKSKKRIIYSHKTCATDTKTMEFVMDACFDTVFTKLMSPLY